jgi:hypothetical protein
MSTDPNKSWVKKERQKGANKLKMRRYKKRLK